MMYLNKPRILLLEDEGITAADIKEILENQGFEVCSICKNFNEALEAFEKDKPDIILADIMLESGKSGIDFVKEVRKNYPDLPAIYISANTDITFREAAFETGPSAFIGKPFQEENLILAIELALDKFMRDSSIPKFSTNGHVFLKKGKRFNKVQTSDIHYVKAEGSYSKFITEDEQYLQSGNLGFYEERLPSDFVRVHKSFIVNYLHIKSISSDLLKVGLEEIPIGRMFKDNVKNIKGPTKD